MSNSNTVYIAVIGVGGVGAHFLGQLAALAQVHTNISMILISRSTKSLLGSPENPIPLSTWSTVISPWFADPSTTTAPDLPSSSTSTRLTSSSPALTIDQTLSFLQKIKPGKTILVDNTSDHSLASAYPSFLTAGISIVTPNKKAFSGTLSLWKSIQSSSYRPYAPYQDRGLIYHESSVGAGLPIISTLKDLIDTGDEVRRIEGVFSGTLSFLFNSFAPVDGAAGGGKWSEEVRKAKELGFTEPDPRDDLNGVDVARKLIILARLAGLEVEGVQSFSVESLIPKELEGVSSGEVFLERLGEFDERMEEVKEGARREGKVVRFVGSVDVVGKGVKVGLEKLGKGSPIAGLKGSDNIVSFYTKRYGDNPLVVQGAGAGGAVTAMGVTADLIKVIQRIS
ncbi:Homoserine dehydrogenase [Lecanora helva]